MQLHNYINTLGQDLKHRFGEKIHKLSINAQFTCPNRDGTLGRGGCTFCNNASFNAHTRTPLSIREQIENSKSGMRAKRFLAYFQAYTNTYAEVSTLRSLYQEALTVSDMVGLCVGTRPDCVPDATLDLLAGYQDEGYEVWLELGLQSAFDSTLERVNRGHGFAAYADAVHRAHQRGIKVCTHLIIGLPGERADDSLVTLERVMEQGCEGLKLHPLHIVRGSRMARQWRQGEIKELTMEAYAHTAAEMIRRTPPAVVYHRVTATARPPTLLAPAWCDNRWPAFQAIGEYLQQHGGQGSALNGGAALNHPDQILK
jgi:hypothetical protein